MFEANLGHKVISKPDWTTRNTLSREAWGGIIGKREDKKMFLIMHYKKKGHKNHGATTCLLQWTKT